MESTEEMTVKPPRKLAADAEEGLAILPISPDLGNLNNASRAVDQVLLVTDRNPNELTRTVHDRMPVILPRETYAAQLDPAADVESLPALLKPE